MKYRKPDTLPVEFGDAMQGIVYRLPKGRGFLAGYTMGEQMASGLDAHIWDDLDDAIRAANDEAHCMADEQQEFEQSERERIDAEELELSALGTDE
jgi:hypothetical protein